MNNREFHAPVVLSDGYLPEALCPEVSASFARPFAEANRGYSSSLFDPCPRLSGVHLFAPDVLRVSSRDESNTRPPLSSSSLEFSGTTASEFPWNARGRAVRTVDRKCEVAPLSQVPIFGEHSEYLNSSERSLSRRTKIAHYLL